MKTGMHLAEKPSRLIPHGVPESVVKGEWIAREAAFLGNVQGLAQRLVDPDLGAEFFH